LYIKEKVIVILAYVYSITCTVFCFMREKRDCFNAIYVFSPNLQNIIAYITSKLNSNYTVRLDVNPVISQPLYSMELDKLKDGTN
jgi:hypothetical protein